MIRREEAEDWFFEGKKDLSRAERALKDEDYSLAVFMAQQAVEKCLKASIMVLVRELPPRTHDLTRIYEMARERLNLSSKLEEELSELSPYYTLSRYPNAGLRRPSVSIRKEFASRMVNLAKEVVKEIEAKCQF